MHLTIDRTSAMCQRGDYAEALREVADWLDREPDATNPCGGPIRDRDGTLVGRWEIGDMSAGD